jgi:hypothetical protein
MRIVDTDGVNTIISKDKWKIRCSQMRKNPSMVAVVFNKVVKCGGLRMVRINKPATRTGCGLFGFIHGGDLRSHPPSKKGDFKTVPLDKVELLRDLLLNVTKQN